MSDPSLTARYNNPNKRPLAKRTRNLLIGGALSLGVVGAAWVGFSNFSAITAQDINFSVQSPSQATAVFEVEYNSKHRLQCDVRAMNESKATVGFNTVLLEATDPGVLTTKRLTVPMHTDNLAVTAGVESCYKVPNEFTK
ncbi:DUF4307 domain-containing protein [Glutamicibacter bergerei]|jgi:hypothetical protein|uniref:DUF4307 domain-containing protein n=1 Tax=Glutamicibacter TaxID=1742989 RepID=UPI000BB7E95C|nr:DUF4307 domain-containing protein [Glutamicibacter sp. BW77]PCC33192.1 hypothetical protein CIK74_12690 [Glutamicibacter sp. BW77]